MRMFTNHLRFECVKKSQRIAYVCGVCGKRKTKTFIVEHTVNPFNRDDNGVPKTRQQVEKDVEQELCRVIAEFGKVCLFCEEADQCPMIP